MAFLPAHLLNLLFAWKCCLPFPDTARVTKDTTVIKGSASASGLVQTGDENRLVTSLLSNLTIGNHHYELSPLTSIAYSTKPHAQVEGEYLENLIFRYHQANFFYPAVGVDFEKSFLRKISYRYSTGVTLVCNILDQGSQRIRLGVGYNHETTQYEANAFKPSLDNSLHFSRSLDQVYLRLKGDNSFFNNALILSYDFFFQPTLQNFSDYRWTLIGNVDLPLNKRLSFRSSAVSSYEEFVATSVARYNFRLTFGLNVTL